MLLNVGEAELAEGAVGGGGSANKKWQSFCISQEKATRLVRGNSYCYSCMSN
jgi:hypothetical protein